MSSTLAKLKTLICKELDTYADQKSLNVESLNQIDKLTHSLKSIVTIMAMEKDHPVNSKLTNGLNSMLVDATTEEEKQAIMDCISKIENK